MKIYLVKSDSLDHVAVNRWKLMKRNKQHVEGPLKSYCSFIRVNIYQLFQFVFPSCMICHTLIGMYKVTTPGMNNFFCMAKAGQVLVLVVQDDTIFNYMYYEPFYIRFYQQT